MGNFQGNRPRCRAAGTIPSPVRSRVHRSDANGTAANERANSRRERDPGLTRPTIDRNCACSSPTEPGNEGSTHDLEYLKLHPWNERCSVTSLPERDSKGSLCTLKYRILGNRIWLIDQSEEKSALNNCNDPAHTLLGNPISIRSHRPDGRVTSSEQRSSSEG